MLIVSYSIVTQARPITNKNDTFELGEELCDLGILEGFSLQNGFLCGYN